MESLARRPLIASARILESWFTLKSDERLPSLYKLADPSYRSFVDFRLAAMLCKSWFIDSWGVLLLMSFSRSSKPRSSSMSFVTKSLANDDCILPDIVTKKHNRNNLQFVILLPGHDILIFWYNLNLLVPETEKANNYTVVHRYFNLINFKTQRTMVSGSWKW